MSHEIARGVVRLAMMAASRQGVSLQMVEAEFECSRRTAQRRIEALVDIFPETDRILDDEQRPWWRLPVRGLAQLLVPNAEELAALQFAAARLARAGGSSEARALRTLHDKVHALIPADRGRRLDADEEALLVAMGHATRPGPRPVGDPEVDEAISTALKGPSHLRILYRGRHETAPAYRTVAPHGLLLGVRKYLVAIDIAKPGVMRHFRVEDIVNAQVLHTSFALDDGFDLECHARRGFGSYQSSDEHHNVVWRFLPGSAERARRFVFHPGQTLETQDDGSLIVRFEASGLLEMCWHLYAWGDKVEVLAPAALKTMVDPYRRSDFPALP